MVIPPYVAVMAAFPFSLNALYAIFGSLGLKFVEFMCTSKLQARTGLDESSIAMTQKMNLVTLPIKMRAIRAGIITGWADAVKKHDNSWWVSFGASGAVTSVKAWLQAILAVMGLTMLIAVCQ